MLKQENKLTPFPPISSLRTPQVVPNSPVSSRYPEARAPQCWELWWAEPLPSSLLGQQHGDPCQPQSPHSSSPVQHTCGAGRAANRVHSTDRAQEGTCTMDPSLPRAHIHPSRWASAWEMRNPSETLRKLPSDSKQHHQLCETGSI